jgi:hypothetical protein
MKHISTALLAVYLLLPVFYQAQPLYVRQIYRANPFPFMALKSSFLLSQPDYSLLNFGTLTSDATITRLDSTGSVLWSRSYRFSSNPNYYSNFIDATNSHDSTFAVVGKVSTGNTNYAAWCAKLKSNGDTIWCRQMTWPNAVSMTPYNISSTLDSGFVVCGLTASFSISGPSHYAFIAKFTKNGALGWIKMLNNPFFNGNAYAIKQTPDSGFIFIGRLNPQPGGASLTKLDKAGNFSWQKTYRDPANTNSQEVRGYDLVIENNGYLCLLKGPANGPTLLKTDFSGNPVWAKTYNLSTYINSTPYDRPLTLGKYFATSRQLTNRGDFSSGACWTMAVDTQGNVQWRGEPNFAGLDVVAYKHKKLAMAGSRFNAMVIGGSLIGPGETGIMITDSLGSTNGTCYIRNPVIATVQVLDTMSVISPLTSGGTISTIQPTLGLITLLDTTGCMLSGVGMDEMDEAATTSVYPNPSDGKITVHSELLNENTLRFELYDVTGRMLMSKECVPGNAEKEINLDMLEPAVYFYSLHSGGEVIKTGKLLIVK